MSSFLDGMPHVAYRQREMEPTRRVNSHMPSFIVTSICLDMHYMNGMHVQYLFFVANPIRMRGGMDNPNVDEKSSDIPYLTNQKFMWNGLPCIDFQEKVMYPIENGLATMTVKGYSLLSACQQTDAGGVFGTPTRAAASADVVAESIHRNQKAYACMMNYITRSCWFYKMANRSPQLRQNGIHLLAAIRNYGVVPLPPRMKKAREDAWQRMSMESLRIPMDSVGYFKWTDVVYESGRKMNKDGNAMLDKWTEGLPTWFNAEKAQIRHDNSANLMHPATYAGLYPGAPNAANMHPLARQPSIQLFSKKYYPDWCGRSMAVSKDVLKTFAVGNEIFSVEDIDGVANLLHYYDITPDTKCFACGGEGHAASQQMKDGSTYLCATKALAAQNGSSSDNGTGRFKRNRTGSKEKEKLSWLEEQVNELMQIADKSSRSAEPLANGISSHTCNTAAAISLWG